MALELLPSLLWPHRHVCLVVLSAWRLHRGQRRICCVEQWHIPAPCGALRHPPTCWGSSWDAVTQKYFSLEEQNPHQISMPDALRRYLMLPEGLQIVSGILRPWGERKPLHGAPRGAERRCPAARLTHPTAARAARRRPAGRSSGPARSRRRVPLPPPPPPAGRRPATSRWPSGPSASSPACAASAGWPWRNSWSPGRGSAWHGRSAARCRLAPRTGRPRRLPASWGRRLGAQPRGGNGREGAVEGLLPALPRGARRASYGAPAVNTLPFLCKILLGSSWNRGLLITTAHHPLWSKNVPKHPCDGSERILPQNQVQNQAGHCSSM